MIVNNDVSGAAALAMRESLIFFLGDRKILAESEVAGILEDTISARLNALADDGITEMREAAAIPVKSTIDGGNSVRCPIVGRV